MVQRHFPKELREFYEQRVASRLSTLEATPEFTSVDVISGVDVDRMLRNLSVLRFIVSQYSSKADVVFISKEFSQNFWFLAHIVSKTLNVSMELRHYLTNYILLRGLLL